MGKIRLSALAYIKAHRNWREHVARVAQGGAQGDPTAAPALASARKALVAAMAEPNAASPYGWPEETERVLKILVRITLPHLNAQSPAEFPGLEFLVQQHIVGAAKQPPPAPRAKPRKPQGRKASYDDATRDLVLKVHDEGRTNPADIREHIQQEFGKPMTIMVIRNVVNARDQKTSRKRRAKAD
jgi:hypothetical protein